MTLKLGVLLAFVTVMFFLLEAFGVALPFTQEEFVAMLLLLLPLLGVEVVEAALRPVLHEAFPSLVEPKRPTSEELERALVQSSKALKAETTPSKKK